jgi:hypothetical protein
VTKHQAHREATARWGTPGISPTDRVAVMCLRRKGVVDRCEVGWYVRGSGETVIAGKRPTWEAAFANADARVCNFDNHQPPGRDPDGEPGNVSE